MIMDRSVTRQLTFIVLLAFFTLTPRVHAASDIHLPLFAYPLQPIQQPVPYKKAVVITHGWTSHAVSVTGNIRIKDWPFTMAEDICQSAEIQGVLDHGTSGVIEDNALGNNQLIRVCRGQNWDVWVIDWASLAGDCSILDFVFSCQEDPEYAYWNATFAGEIAARYLADLGYNHLHLIAHSAGSQVIETIKNQLLVFDSPPAIQMTFLDPFDPQSVETDISRYGAQADWVDNYIDLNVGGGNFIGVPDPKNKLINGYTYDVTNAPPRDLINVGHKHPYKFYQQSVTTPAAFHGFPLSLEANGSMDLLSNLPRYRSCEVASMSAPCSKTTIGRPVRTDDQLLCTAGSTKCPAEITQIAATVEVTRAKSGIEVRLGTKAGSTDAVGVLLSQFVPEGATHVSFDYQFDGARGDFAVVTFDGKSIRLVSGAVSGTKVTKVAPIWLGDEALEGSHSIGFIGRNPFSGNLSMKVTNIRFERRALAFSPELLTADTQTNRPHKLGWTALHGAAQYAIELIDSKGAKHLHQILSDQVGCSDEAGECHWPLPTDLPAGKVIWHVMGSNPDNIGEWSSIGSIEVAAAEVAVAGDSQEKSGGGGAMAAFLFLLLSTKRKDSP